MPSDISFRLFYIWFMTAFAVGLGYVLGAHIMAKLLALL